RQGVPCRAGPSAVVCRRKDPMNKILPPARADRRSLLAKGAALLQGGTLLWLGPSQLAWGAQVLAVRVWPAADYTRVTVESDIALGAKHFMMDNPPRLVIDVE